MSLRLKSGVYNLLESRTPSGKFVQGSGPWDVGGGVRLALTEVSDIKISQSCSPFGIVFKAATGL